eukprot:8033781-Karenia_brevis.AAC.1
MHLIQEPVKDAPGHGQGLATSRRYGPERLHQRTVALADSQHSGGGIRQQCNQQHRWRISQSQGL